MEDWLKMLGMEIENEVNNSPLFCYCWEQVVPISLMEYTFLIHF